MVNGVNSISARGSQSKECKRIAGEDYYRVLKQNREINQSNKAKKGGGNLQTMGLDSISRIQHSKMMGDATGQQPLNENGDELDFEQSDDVLLAQIELPQETLYLIDKVVRLKAKSGPIGVDNSELINIEMEGEFKEKNRYIQNLVSGSKGNGNNNESEYTREDKENIDN